MFFAKLARLLPRGLREALFWLGVKQFLRKAGAKEEDVGKFVGLITGWKSKAGGLVAIGTGLAMIGHALSGEFSFDELMKGFAMIGAGMSVFGLAGKAEKLTTATLVAGGQIKEKDVTSKGTVEKVVAKE